MSSVYKFDESSVDSSSVNDDLIRPLDKDDILKKLENQRKEKLMKNVKFEKKKNLVDEFTMNFYGDPDVEKTIARSGNQNKMLDKLDEEERQKRLRKGFMDPEEKYKEMMKNINTSNKKYLDAIRFKTTQEIKEFKKIHLKIAQ